MTQTIWEWSKSNEKNGPASTDVVVVAVVVLRRTIKNRFLTQVRKKKYGIQLEDVEKLYAPVVKLRGSSGLTKQFLQSGIQSKLTTSIGSKNNTKLPIILPYLIQVALKSTKYSQVLDSLSLSIPICFQLQT